MSNCSIIKALVIVEGNKSLSEISELIASDSYKEQVIAIRTLNSLGQVEDANFKKKTLPGFTPAGIFKSRRTGSTLTEYSKLVHLDFDDLSPSCVKSLSISVSKILFTRMCFESPSGTGLKVFVEVNSDFPDHDLAYRQVLHHYEVHTGIKPDTSCKDIARLCFMSWDPNIFFNVESKIFNVEVGLPQNNLVEADREIAANACHVGSSTIEEAIRITQAKMNYIKGNRNNYIYFLGRNCNRLAVPESEILYFCLKTYELRPSRIKGAIRSAYKNRDEFGKLRHLLNHEDQHSLAEEEVIDQEDQLLNTPFIPAHLYPLLPKILQSSTSMFSDQRRQDIALTGMLVALSGCMPNVRGKYDNRWVYPHLYAIITAPPASGKGIVELVKRALQKHHANIITKSREELQLYELELEQYTKNASRKQKSQRVDRPNKPKNKVLFIPANCSTTRMVELLSESDGEGIIIETEVDAMANATKQEWGDYSQILRNAFHHESISITRKTDNVYIQMPTSKIACLLAGTPSQIPKLISSAEDGLLSRLINYLFKNSIGWVDPSPKDGRMCYDEHFDIIGEEVVLLVEYLENNPTEVFLSSSQWAAFNQEFGKVLNDVAIYTDEGAASIVFRLGLITYRICMILTALRKFEAGDRSTNICCIDQDFNCALSLSLTYLQHNILMYNNLPKNNTGMMFDKGENKRKLYSALPLQFSRKDAVRIGRDFNLKSRSVDMFLKASLGELLEKEGTGLYRKLESKL